ncbi:hypothetical protein F5Y19DRAFT_490411 [Xylariaceae sp. FL1651]|nr:hypothetical protein F5Y19DRAFT_490411 [Xylariaceae sp. FL1651]
MWPTQGLIWPSSEHPHGFRTVDQTRPSVVKPLEHALTPQDLSIWSQKIRVSDRFFRPNMLPQTQGFDVSKLPQTINDAINVRRGLEIPYVWVDSICIIRDIEDWEKEAARIREVYANYRGIVDPFGAALKFSLVILDP